MPIKNPILDAVADTTVQDIDTRAFDRNLAATVDGVKRTVNLLVDSKIEGIKDDFGEELHNEELQFRQELGAQLASENTPDADLLALPNVDEERLKGAAPQVREIMALDAKDRRGVKQGFLDANDYQIRTEARFRQYLTRYPHLADELLSVARNAGGFGLIPADLQAAFDDIKDIQSAAASGNSEVERLRKISKEQKVDQSLYTTDPQTYWKLTLQFANAEQDIAISDQKFRARKLTGDMNEYTLKADVAKAVPGYITQAWSKDIVPTVTASLGIANINQYNPESYDPVALNNIRQELQLKKSSFLASMYSKYGGGGDISTETIKDAAQPTLDAYDAAIERLGSKTFASDMQDYVKTQTNGLIATMPNGPALVVATDMARGLDRTFTSGLVNSDISTKLSTALISLFPGGTENGRANNYDAQGELLPFARNNALIELDNNPAHTDADVQNGVITYVNHLNTTIRELAKNKDPAYANINRNATLDAMRTFTDYYNDPGLKNTKGAMSTNVSDAIVELGASDTFKDAFAGAPPDLQQALVQSFRATATSEFDNIMRGEISQDLTKVLRFDARGTFQSTESATPFFGGPGLARSITREATEALSSSQPVVLTISPKDGSAFFVVDNAIAGQVASSDLNDVDKRRISRTLTNAANELTTKYGKRLTNVVRMTAHVTPGANSLPKPYGAAFGVLAESLLANGEVNLGIDIEAIN